jgi:acetyltransferase-like isoleucine patch superfamily enzyme
MITANIGAVPDPVDQRQVVEVRHKTRTSRVIAAKRFLQAVFTMFATPRTLIYRTNRIFMGSRALLCASESIARIPGMRGVYMRQAFYKKTLARCGRDVYFGWQSVFSMPEARVGEGVYIGRFCSIGFADIGDEAMLADGVQILSGGREHATRAIDGQTMREQAQTYEQVRIGRGAWIGARAVVMADVGENAIVGAGAVVNRPIPAGCVAVGVPARVVKSPPDRTPE